jgi:hypothetical protein
MAAIISSAVAPWAVVCGVHMVIPGVFTAVRNVIMGAAQSVGNRIWVDPRNYPYIPWQFFIMVWAPALLAYRQ